MSDAKNSAMSQNRLRGEEIEIRTLDEVFGPRLRWVYSVAQTSMRHHTSYNDQQCLETKSFPKIQALTTKTVTAYQVFDRNEVPASGVHESRRAAWTEVAKEHPFILEVIVRFGGIPTKITAGNEQFSLKEVRVETFWFAYQIVDHNGDSLSSLHEDPGMAWREAANKHPLIINLLNRSDGIPAKITIKDESFALKKLVPRFSF